MNENFFSKLSSKDKERSAYIEGRPDLFETKILRIKTPDGKAKEASLLVSTRDPGSANALLPVLKELSGDRGLNIDLVTDGRAQEIIQKNFQFEDITPANLILAADSVIDSPQVILIDSSTEMGIDTYVSATFPEVPTILVEDHYASAIDFLTALIKRKLPLPKKICVMDKRAKEIIVNKFPQLVSRIEVTGQPAFDRFFKEDAVRLASEVKDKLGLKPTDRLVSFMSSLDDPKEIEQIAKALKGIANDFYFAFRRHPRDNVSYETYKKILTDAGIRVVDTNELPTNDVGAASDVVLTTWSTEGMHGIYRRKPTVHIIDPNFEIPKGLVLPLPPVKLGASVGIGDIDEIAKILPQLLSSGSDLNENLKKNMEEQYPIDGKNTERVANIVRQYLK